MNNSTMHNLSIIAAIGENKELGKGSKLPWHISDDLKRFKKITSGHTVIMGRNTFDSINNKPLANRRNIILTKDTLYKHDHIEVVHSLDAALKKLDPAEESFIVGGAAIYKLFLPVTNKLYLTVVHKSFDADVFFPEFNPKDWKEMENIAVTGDKSGLDYSYITLERISYK
jgi:dihydrofolate reductase